MNLFFRYFHVFAVLFFVFVVAPLGIILIGDNVSATLHQGAGTIVEKKFHKSYTSYAKVGKITVPQHHPSRWEIRVSVDGEKHTMSVSEKEYDMFFVGERVTITYTKGNWIGGVNVESVEKNKLAEAE